MTSSTHKSNSANTGGKGRGDGEGGGGVCKGEDRQGQGWTKVSNMYLREGCDLHDGETAEGRGFQNLIDFVSNANLSSN